MTGTMVSHSISRAHVPADVQANSALFVAFDTSSSETPDTDLSTITSDWKSPGFALDRDARVTTTATGKVIGYEVIYSVAQDGRIKTDGYVHPEFVGQAIGTQLLRWAETRAR